MDRRRAVLFLLAGALSAAACGRGGSDPPRGAAPAPPQDPFIDVRVAPAPGISIPDEALVDQDGATVRLRDLAEDRVIVVNFVFTTCTTICSPMTAVFARLQAELGDALGREVRLVSITLDPAVDTPARLRQYAEPFGRREGWSFLTGPRERVNRVLDALGGRAPSKEGHTPLTLIGRAAEGRWTRVDGIAPPRRLADEIRAFLPRGEHRGAASPPAP